MIGRLFASLWLTLARKNRGNTIFSHETHTGRRKLADMPIKEKNDFKEVKITLGAAPNQNLC